MADKQVTPFEIPNGREGVFCVAGLKLQGDGLCASPKQFGRGIQKRPVFLPFTALYA
jgi:hypothetical protein